MTEEQEENDPNKKKFTFYLMYDWKNGGKPSVYKREPYDKAGPYEIVEKVERTIKVPEKKQYKSEGTIDIPEGKLSDMVVEEL